MASNPLPMFGTDLQSNSIAQRRKLAQTLLEKATSKSEGAGAAGAFGALAKALQGGFGGYERSQADRFEGERNRLIAEELAKDPSAENMMRVYSASGDLDASDAMRLRTAQEERGTQQDWLRERAVVEDDFKRQQLELQKRKQTLDENTPVNVGNAYVLPGTNTVVGEKPLGGTDKKAVLEAEDTIHAADNAISGMKNLLIGGPQSVNERAGHGVWGGTIQPWLASNDPTGVIMDQSKAQATQELTSQLYQSIAENIKASFGANPSNAEREFLVQMNASADKPPATRRAILEKGMKLMEARKAQNAERAEQIRGGTYFKPGGGVPNSAPPPAAAPAGAGGDVGALIAKGRAAIAQGKDPAGVKDKLMRMGVPAELLSTLDSGQ